ncbi:hypothetical protein CK203_070929 [Vitis vinifera]|uniref:Uncharacterized protein n=1 Tax=Vitis vinifera TaxID=29760 RepID=A0A438E3S2_VITVI|nr:hypothetical protein CK203_070929 [Vitis vinifera]
MALKENQEETPISENPNGDEEGGEESQADGVGDFEDEDEDEAEEEDEEEEARSEKSRESRLAEDGSKLESMFRRLASEKVKLRVHDVLIKGNTKTKDSLIEAELEAIKNATTMQELLKAAGIANHRFHSFGIFDSVGITLDCGPPELPGTVNVIVDVVETKNPLTGDLGIFTKPEAYATLVTPTLLFNQLLFNKVSFGQIALLGYNMPLRPGSSGKRDGEGLWEVQHFVLLSKLLNNLWSTTTTQAQIQVRPGSTSINFNNRFDMSCGQILARTWSLEGSLKLKNLFGYGDLWDGSLVYGWDQSSEISAGVSLPRFKGMVTPMLARVSLLSQDWLKFSSYKERSLGLNLGLISTKRHDLTYNLLWRTLTDPSQMSSRAVRRQLGHGLLSSLNARRKVQGGTCALEEAIFVDGGTLHFSKVLFQVYYSIVYPLYDSKQSKEKTGLVLMGVSMGRTTDGEGHCGHVWVALRQAMGGRPSFGMTLKKCYLDLYVLALYKDTWVLWKEGGALVTGCLDLQGGSFAAYPCTSRQICEDKLVWWEIRRLLFKPIVFFFLCYLVMHFVYFLSMWEIDLRCAIPLGFYRTALNLGISGGVIFPWGNGALSMPSSLPERFFLGGNSSPVCTLGGPTTLLGFKSRGLGPTERRRLLEINPMLFRDAGIHGHVFACAGNLTKLTENEFRKFSFQNSWIHFEALLDLDYCANQTIPYGDPHIAHAGF